MNRSSEAAQGQGSGRIVVGVDGSQPSRDALRWALGQAQRTGARVVAVHVWQYPSLTYAGGLVAAPVFAGEDLEEEARAVLDDAVEDVLGDVVADGPGERPAVERVVIEGSAGPVLVQEAHGADLLVVGHRGHGGFRELVLGSVAHQCSAHAPCPVVIVRHDPEAHRQALTRSA